MKWVIPGTAPKRSTTVWRARVVSGTTFLSRSDWRSSNPNNNAYSLSGDRFLVASELGPLCPDLLQAQPARGLATVWEFYFDPSKAADRTRVATKFAVVSQLFDLL